VPCGLTRDVEHPPQPPRMPLLQDRMEYIYILNVASRAGPMQALQYSAACGRQADAIEQADPGESTRVLLPVAAS
jgi:hypothetical protein